MRKTCGFLSTDNLEEFFVYDTLTIEYLADLGWDVTDISWKDTSVNYNDFDIIIVRSTWDYQQDVSAFLNCLETIEASSAILQNTLSLMRWNVSKDYLKDLANHGIPILPTVWLDTYDYQSVVDSFVQFDCQEVVMKPLISANADDTFRLSKANIHGVTSTLSSVFENRHHIIQPFEYSIINEGEYSLFYFSGQFSHAILKTPKNGDFRVQEEHGGELMSVTPDKDMRLLADKVLQALPEQALYARIDFVRHNGALALMEVELIEPSLYFNMDEASPKRFALAVDSYYQERMKNNLRS